MTKTTTSRKKVKLSAMTKGERVRALTALIQAQPDILMLEPKLINVLKLDDPTEGNVTSLAKRQADRFKEELAKNTRRTQDLIDNAKNFEVINNKIYELIYDLSACANIDELIDTIAIKTPNLFNIDFVEIRSAIILDESTNNMNRYFNEQFNHNPDYQHVMKRLAQGKSLCSDRFPQSVIKFFFADQQPDVKSIAFIPLIGADNLKNSAFGALAFASRDKEKFSSGLRGTVHLERIGKILALSIERMANTYSA